MADGDATDTPPDAGAEAVGGAMVERFKERAKAVRARGIPPLEGADRRRFVERMQLDYQDFAMLADAVVEMDDGVLVLRIDLRPQSR